MSNDVDEADDVAARLRTLWFVGVAEISDIDLQRRTWLDLANTNLYWSYIEFICSYPDLSQLTDAHERSWLTTSQFSILRDLRQTILSHSAPGGDDYDHAAVLADPAWLEVVTCARRARQELLSTVISGGEREVLSIGK